MKSELQLAVDNLEEVEKKTKEAHDMVMKAHEVLAQATKHHEEMRTAKARAVEDVHNACPSSSPF